MFLKVSWEHNFGIIVSDSPHMNALISIKNSLLDNNIGEIFTIEF